MVNPVKAESPEFHVVYEVPEHKTYAYELVKATWSEDQFAYFDTIINIESGWNHLAQNPTSTAFGYGQFLDSTWAGVGCIKTTDPNEQIKCTVKYIKARYRTPEEAVNWHYSHNWY